jgi:hypothetical protein
MNRNPAHILAAAIFLFATAAIAAEPLVELEPRLLSPKSVANFSLFDIRGKRHELHRAGGEVVVLFSSTVSGSTSRRASAPTGEWQPAPVPPPT